MENNKLTNAPRIKQPANNHNVVSVTSFDDPVVATNINDTYNEYDSRNSHNTFDGGINPPIEKNFFDENKEELTGVKKSPNSAPHPSKALLINLNGDKGIQK